MTGKQLRDLVPVWAKQIGPDEAKKLLVFFDVKLSTADHLVRGTYDAIPKEELCGKIKLAMKDYLAALEAS